METPPRTWRRPVSCRRSLLNRRNTSTDVEKTCLPSSCGRWIWKHLHGRGEDTDEPPIILDAWETPPRTWRRLTGCGVERLALRNTSTDVEKTSITPAITLATEKHLHGRGEDVLEGDRRSGGLETPPRTWRRQKISAFKFEGLGNTSTDVEKTSARVYSAAASKKHLHGRGEDIFDGAGKNWSRETPPRTWRRQKALQHQTGNEGNTSTDVEKTSGETPANQGNWKHLHGRGEDRT